MADQEYSFAQARTRLEEIVTQVRKKDTTLEKSLDLLEEGVRLANTCTELSDHTEWQTILEEQAAPEQDEPSAQGAVGTGDDDTVGELAEPDTEPDA